MKKLGIILLLSMSLILVTGCSLAGNTSASSSESTTSSTQEKINVQVKVTDKNKDTTSNEEIETTETTNLLDLMKQKHKLEEKDGLITAIDGLKQDEQAGYYWTYTINGEWATKGAQETFLKDGDQIEFAYGKVE